MKKDRFNLIIGAIVIAVGALIGWRYYEYLRYRETVKTELARPDMISEKFSKELAALPTDAAPSEDPAAPANTEPLRGALGGPAAAPGQKETTEGEFQVKKSYTEHGRSVVVKSAGNAAEYKKAGSQFAPVEPNYDAPYNLSYQGLRKVNLYLRLHEKWPKEVLQQLHGAAVTISGMVMPVATVEKSGALLQFWLANPVVVMAGCVFCNPPTFADLLLVDTPMGTPPLIVDREQLYTDLVPIAVTGRLFFGYHKTGDGIETLFRIEMTDWKNIR